MATGVYKRNDHWWIRYADADGKMVYVSQRGKSQKEARVELDKRRIVVATQRKPITTIIKKKTTFSELTIKYHEYCESQKAYKKKKLVINSLDKYFGGWDLVDINIDKIDNYLTPKKNKGNAPSTINKHIACLHGMFTKACEWELVSEEQNTKIHTVKLLKCENERKRFLSIEQKDTFIAECKKREHIYDIVVCALHTGCRLSEILGLTWEENVDLAHGNILLDITKGEEGRKIAISDTFREILKRRKKNNTSKSPYVFYYNEKTGEKLGSIKTAFNNAKKRADIKWLHFHDLRHTFASHLVMNHTSLATLRELLGHATTQMTQRYSHLSDTHLKQAIHKLDKIYATKPASDIDPVVKDLDTPIHQEEDMSMGAGI